MKIKHLLLMNAVVLLGLSLFGTEGHNFLVLGAWVSWTGYLVLLGMEEKIDE